MWGIKKSVSPFCCCSPQGIAQLVFAITCHTSVLKKGKPHSSKPFNIYKQHLVGWFNVVINIYNIYQTYFTFPHAVLISASFIDPVFCLLWPWWPWTMNTSPRGWERCTWCPAMRCYSTVFLKMAILRYIPWYTHSGLNDYVKLC